MGDSLPCPSPEEEAAEPSTAGICQVCGKHAEKRYGGEGRAAKRSDYYGRWSAAYDVFKPYYRDRYDRVFEELGLEKSVLGLLDRLIAVSSSDEAAFPDKEKD